MSGMTGKTTKIMVIMASDYAFLIEMRRKSGKSMAEILHVLLQQEAAPQMSKMRGLRLKLRKHTTPVHWLIGAVAATLVVWCWPAAVALLLVFALDEYWDDWCHGKKEGEDDWWEAGFVAFLGLVVVVILYGIGLINVKWWL